jgi:nucleoside-diphosphate-sugar epimerase
LATNILVTGSNGFIGRNLLSRLSSDYPGANISCLVRSPRPEMPGVSSLEVNYADPQSLSCCQAIQDADLIFHIAGVTKAASEKLFWRGNVEPLSNLLQVLGQRSQLPQRLVFISSQAASGPARHFDHYKTEEEPDTPFEFYGKSKLAAEKLLIENPFGIPYSIIRPSAVYGPHDVDFLQLFKMVKSRLNIYFGAKRKHLSLVYVEDLIEGIIQAAKSDAALNQTFFLCNDAGVTWQEIQEGIFQVMEKDFFEVNVPVLPLKLLAAIGTCYSLLTGQQVLLNSNKIALSEPDYWLASNQKAKQLLDFHPKVSLLEGLARTRDWYRDKGLI